MLIYLGAYLSSSLARRLLVAGIDPSSISLDRLINPLTSASPTLEGPLRSALAVTIAHMFIIAFIAALADLLAVLFAQSGKISQLMHERATDQTAEW